MMKLFDRQYRLFAVLSISSALNADRSGSVGFLFLFSSATLTPKDEMQNTVLR